MSILTAFLAVWKKTSPLACLYGIGLLIIASDRLAHALNITGALLWVYCLSMLAEHAGSRIFPRRGKKALLVVLASFVTSFYLLLHWIISPLGALPTFFAISLVPMLYVSSGILERIGKKSLGEKFLESVSEALLLGVLIIILALIREPVGYMSLSLPGGVQGIVLLFSFDPESSVAVRLISSSSGALLILGYCYGLYRHYKAKKTQGGRQ